MRVRWHEATSFSFSCFNVIDYFFIIWPILWYNWPMFIFFLLIWVIFNGRITPEILVIGCFISVGISMLIYKALGYPATTDKKIIRNFPLLLMYAGNLILEIFKAAFQVIKLVWSKEEKPDPVMVEFHSGLEGEFSNVLLANSITLTPGTFTVHQEGDRLVVHCLRPEYAEGIEESSFIQLLRRVKG